MDVKNKVKLRGECGKSLQAYLDHLGMEYEVLSRRRHYRIRVFTPQGSFTTTCPRSSSDGSRGVKNNLAQLRRYLRERGVEC